jgi:mannose-6-phosphate isomerase class I
MTRTTMNKIAPNYLPALGLRRANYDLHPSVAVSGQAGAAVRGWPAIGARIQEAVTARTSARAVVAIECYPEVFEHEIAAALAEQLRPVAVFRSAEAFLPPAAIDALVAPELGGDDPVFGRLSRLTLEQFLDPARRVALRAKVDGVVAGLVVVIGPAALLCCEPDLVIYADMPRWEGQLRQRRNEVSNLGVENRTLKASLQYKRSFFIDWRVCDKLKQASMARWDFLLDTTVPGDPRLVSGEALRAALRQAVARPFRVVPFFDPGPWGGQWMRQVCQLPDGPPNYAWCFDCVPEENSLRLGFGEVVVEVPAINLVFAQPRALLGEAVYGRLGAEFPIRFDFLDTMLGGNLSFQVHPLTEYAREHFGLPYTQDESYYILDAEPTAEVYLGHRDGVEPAALLAALEAAQRGEKPFDDARFAARFPAKKHDHFLIPAGTLHCSGAGSMVLEISATPYIFTFKLWDWARLGLDGQPRPVNIARAKHVIQWDRDESYARRNLVNQITPVATGPGWREERTGLHEAEFIETRRHWFKGPVAHDTGGGVNVLNLIQGAEAVVESPTGAFAPFVVHYAETFIVPAAVGAYTIRPHGEGCGTECATLKAFVRTRA